MSLEDDLKDVGDSISKLVDNAVNSQNFQELDRKISNTIRQFVYPSQQNRARRDRYRDLPPDRRLQWPPRTDDTWPPRTETSDTSRTPAARTFRQQTRPAPYSGWQRPVRASQYQERFLPPAELSFLSGVQMLAGGTVAGLCFLICIAFLTEGFFLGNLVGAGIFGAAMAAGGWLFLRGRRNQKMGRNLRKIRDILGSREFISVKELADRMQMQDKKLSEELHRMLRKGLFLQGHMDRQDTCLMVTHTVYQQYLELEAQQQKKEQEAQKKEEELKASGLSQEHQKMIAEGEAYIQKIHQCNEDLPGEVISNKLTRLELVVTRILDEARRHPDQADQLHKFMDYYMPTTWKLLEAYRRFEQEPIQSENIEKTKREIESTLDTINAAFEKLLDDLFQTTAWDISSDISVLESMLAQEGLTGNGFDHN